jgi:hypothetical protein
VGKQHRVVRFDNRIEQEAQARESGTHAELGILIFLVVCSRKACVHQDFHNFLVTSCFSCHVLSTGSHKLPQALKSSYKTYKWTRHKSHKVGMKSHKMVRYLCIQDETSAQACKCTCTQDDKCTRWTQICSGV